MKEKGKLFFTILIFAVISVLLFMWLPSAGTIVTTSPSTPMDSAEFSGDKLEVDEDSYETLEIDKESLEAMLKSYEEPSNLSMDITFTLSPSSEDTSTTYIKYRKNGSRETVRYYGAGQKLLTTYTITSRGVSVSDNQTGESYTLPSNSIFTSDRLLGLPDLEWFYGAAESNVSQMRFDTLGNTRVIYLEYRYPRLSQTEKYWISTENGVILRSETLMNGRTYMTVNVTDIE